MFRHWIRLSFFLFVSFSSCTLWAATVVVLETEGKGEIKEVFDRELDAILELSEDLEALDRQEIGISDLILGAGCDKPSVECML